MTDYSDQEIVQKIKNGEIDYFSHLVNKYTKVIYNYIVRRLYYDKEDADDVVQEAFLNFYKSISRFDESKPVLPYLFEIAKNQLKMYLRAKKSNLPLKEEIIVREETINPYLEYNIDELLKVLTKDLRKIMLLLSEGYSYEEIAQKVNKPLNTVKTLIRRARLKILKNSQKKSR